SNAFWLASLWKFRGIRTSSGLFMTTNSPLFLIDFLLAPSIEGRTGLVLVILGMGGLVGWWFTGRRPAAAAFGVSIIVLIAFFDLGSVWDPTKTLEPLRLRVAFYFLLAVPAGSSVAGLSGWLARGVGGGRRGAVAVGLAWGAILAG